MERLLSLDLGDLIGVDGTAFCSRRGELTLRVDAFTLLAKSLRPPPGEAPRPDRRRDPLSPARARPDRQRGGPRAVHHPRAGDLCGAPVPRRGGVHRGRDAGPAAALRRRHGPPVHDPSQRPGPRPLPADRHRALPQAADRRRPGAGLRAGQELPQRGRRHHPQPRVHDARVVRGLRRLPRRGRALRAAGRGAWPRRSATRGEVRPPAPVAARDAGRRDPRAHRDRHPGPPRPRRPGRARWASAGCACPRTTPGPSWSTSWSPSTSSRP